MLHVVQYRVLSPSFPVFTASFLVKKPLICIPLRFRTVCGCQCACYGRERPAYRGKGRLSGHNASEDQACIVDSVLIADCIMLHTFQTPSNPTQHRSGASLFLVLEALAVYRKYVNLPIVRTIERESERDSERDRERERFVRSRLQCQLFPTITSLLSLHVLPSNQHI
jgi:hypothetical protein